MLFGAWSDVKSATISNCWNHAFKTDENEIEDQNGKASEDEDIEAEEEDSDNNFQEVPQNTKNDDIHVYARWDKLREKINMEDSLQFEDFVRVGELVETCETVSNESLVKVRLWLRSLQKKRARRKRTKQRWFGTCCRTRDSQCGEVVS